MAVSEANEVVDNNVNSWKQSLQIIADIFSNCPSFSEKTMLNLSEFRPKFTQESKD